MSDGLIGGIEPREIVIVPYEQDWVVRFERERERIRRALGERALRVDHVGSTAVPGLDAKPIVDIDVSVADVEREDTYLPALLAAGYELRVRQAGHRMVRTPTRDVHVHICSAGSEWERRHLLFRDRLRADSADREAYASLKRAISAEQWPDMNAYSEAKGELIIRIMERAESWARATGWSMQSRDQESATGDGPLVLVIGAALVDDIDAGIVPTMVAHGWRIITSDSDGRGGPAVPATADGVDEVVARANRDHGTISAVILGWTHDPAPTILEAAAVALARQAEGRSGAIVALTRADAPGEDTRAIVAAAARDWSPRGISVNAVVTGTTHVPGQESPVRPPRPGGRLDPPHHLPEVVAFLLSENGRWVSGQLMHGTDGFSARY